MRSLSPFLHSPCTMAAIMRPRGLSLILLAVAVGCSEPAAPKSEKDVVLESFETKLLLPDPDYAVLTAHAAWLGREALTPIARAFPGARGLKRRKVARLAEALAFHGYRSPEVVTAMKDVVGEKDLEAKQSMMNVHFWSAVERQTLKKYWDPRGNFNALQQYALPFGNCRELLAALKLPGFTDGGGVLVGDKGRTPETTPPVLQAAGNLTQVWRKDNDPGVKLFAAIQAFRAGDAMAPEVLVNFLQPPPDGWEKTPQAGPMKERALRVLQETTGRTETEYEEWKAWWQKNQPRKGSPGKTPKPVGTPGK